MKIKAEEYRIKELSKLMVEVVYSNFAELLKSIGLPECLIKLKDYNNHFLTAEGRLYCINNDGDANVICENIIELTEDIQLGKLIEAEENDDDSRYASPIEAYYLWCNNVITVMENLKEEHFPKIDKIISRINKIPISYTRNILTEKTKQN